MKFTNLTRAGIYFTCCHREVEPGGSFECPWLKARTDRAVRAAMADGSLGWESRKDEPEIPGSRHVPTEAEKAAAEAKRRAAAEKAAKEQAAKGRARIAKDEAAIKANMSRMGNYNLPKKIHRRTPERAVARDKPVTAADIITDRKPMSLADVMRHNKAVRMMQANKARQARQVTQDKQATGAPGR